jgi:hypothetical protein
MKPYKASGPDGFQCIFFKQYWHIVGDAIFNLVKIAFSIGHFDPNISKVNISTTVLLPHPQLPPPLPRLSIHPPP